MLEVGRVFYNNHGPYPGKGLRDTLIDGHINYSNGIKESITPIYFERINYENRLNGLPAAKKKSIN
jgi:hypothetical protein